jgi:glycosyltransferase involved in cell wall biosynthesis
MQVENDNRSTKKVLVIFSYMLSPDRDAGSLRMYNILRIFKALSWQVTFAVSDLLSSPAQRSCLQTIEIEVLEKPAVDSIEGYLQEYGKAYDLVIMSALSVALKYFSCIRKNAPDAKVVFDTTDLQHVREYRRAKVTGEGGWLQIALRSKKWELAAVRAADCTLVVSPTEKALLEQACPGAKTHILSVIQTVYGSARSFSEREGIIFIGSFPHHPNVDAMQYFVDKIYPLLRTQIPGEKIIIIGPEPPDWLQKRATDDLNIMGYVPDIAPYFDRCKLSIAPLRYGAGVNGKIMLSMSYGVPVVASSVAAEGIPLTNGKEVLIADNPLDFSQAIVKLSHDERLWNHLSKNGLGIINQHFSFETGRSHLVRLLEMLELA